MRILIIKQTCTTNGHNYMNFNFCLIIELINHNTAVKKAKKENACVQFLKIHERWK